MSVTHYPPGLLPASSQPGDFFLVRDWREDALGTLIQAGERTRYGNTDWARWTHCGLITDTTGGTIEALAGGVERWALDKYRDADLHIVNVSQPADRRLLAVEFAERQLDTRYDVLDFLALAIRSLSGWDVSLHSGRRFICSGLVARATEKYIVGYPLAAEECMPADLAAYWGARSGEPLPALNWLGRALNLLAAVGRLVTGRKAIKDDAPSRGPLSAPV